MEFTDVEALLANQATETLTLEFKSGAALARGGGRDAEIVKDITAMANAAGGRIVYGIQEIRENGITRAANIRPVEDLTATSDWVTQIVVSNTSPRFTAFKIEQIAIPGQAAGLRIVIVDVEQAATAHQSTFDHVYYQRVNAVTTRMLDFQIRDVMGRRSGPQLEVLLQKAVIGRNQGQHFYEYSPTLHNEGVLSIDRWRLVVDFPADAIDRAAMAQVPAHGGHHIENITIDGQRLYRVIYLSDSPHLANVGLSELHPDQSVQLDVRLSMPAIRLMVDQDRYRQFLRDTPSIRWRLYMRDARPIDGELTFEQWCDF